ncbi:MAG: hypothetical protein LBE32_04210 [Burkholderiales bacterium]|nr:hypothetical protein [Burkholderiales bacterium]
MYRQWRYGGGTFKIIAIETTEEEITAMSKEIQAAFYFPDVALCWTHRQRGQVETCWPTAGEGLSSWY